MRSLPRHENRLEVANRSQELEAVRHGMETPSEPDEDFSEAIVGAHQPTLQADPPAQRERPRLLGEKRVGAGFDEESTGALGLDRAAQTIAGLDERQVERRPALACDLDGAVSGSQPGDAAADDDESHREASSWCWTRSASTAMKRG